MPKKKAEPIDYSKFPFSRIYGERAHCQTDEPGRCPVCGDTEIDYKKFYFDEGHFCYWTAKCSKGHKYEEWFSMQHHESVQRFPDVPEEARQ